MARIVDEFSHLPNRQAYQARHRRDNLCLYCPAPALPDGTACEACNTRRKLGHRKAAQCKPWRPGGSGRPPLVR